MLENKKGWGIYVLSFESAQIDWHYCKKDEEMYALLLWMRLHSVVFKYLIQKYIILVTKQKLLKLSLQVQLLHFLDVEVQCCHVIVFLSTQKFLGVIKEQAVALSLVVVVDGLHQYEVPPVCRVAWSIAAFQQPHQFWQHLLGHWQICRAELQQHVLFGIGQATACIWKPSYHFFKRRMSRKVVD